MLNELTGSGAPTTGDGAASDIANRKIPRKGVILGEVPLKRPKQRLEWLNEPKTYVELESIRRIVKRGRPYRPER